MGSTGALGRRQPPSLHIVIVIKHFNGASLKDSSGAPDLCTQIQVRSSNEIFFKHLREGSVRPGEIAFS